MLHALYCSTAKHVNCAEQNTACGACFDLFPPTATSQRVLPKLNSLQTCCKLSTQRCPRSPTIRRRPHQACSGNVMLMQIATRCRGACCHRYRFPRRSRAMHRGSQAHGWCVLRVFQAVHALLARKRARRALLPCHHQLGRHALTSTTPCSEAPLLAPSQPTTTLCPRLRR